MGNVGRGGGGGAGGGGRLQRHKNTLILSNTHTNTHTRTYACTHARTHARTHTTNTCITGTLRRGEQYAEEKRWVFSFDLRE